MIGVSCTHFAKDAPEEWLERVFGEFELWEIFSEGEHSIVNNRQAFDDLLSRYDISYSLHAPICDLNIASLSDRLREASVKEIMATTVAANELGIGLMTVHPGLSSMAVNGMEGRALEHSKRVMRVLEKLSDEYGVVMAIENMPNLPFFLGRTAEQLADIIDGTDLSVCLDIGHANTTGQMDRMVELLGDRIANVHIHDNNGERDEHLTIGDGSIDFDRVLDSLSDYGGNFVIESRDFESAVESQIRLERLLEEE